MFLLPIKLEEEFSKAIFFFVNKSKKEIYGYNFIFPLCMNLFNFNRTFQMMVMVRENERKAWNWPLYNCNLAASKYL